MWMKARNQITQPFVYTNLWNPMVDNHLVDVSWMPRELEHQQEIRLLSKEIEI